MSTLFRLRQLPRCNFAVPIFTGRSFRPAIPWRCGGCMRLHVTKRRMDRMGNWQNRKSGRRHHACLEVNNGRHLFWWNFVHRSQEKQRQMPRWDTIISPNLILAESQFVDGFVTRSSYMILHEPIDCMRVLPDKQNKTLFWWKHMLKLHQKKNREQKKPTLGCNSDVQCPRICNCIIPCSFMHNLTVSVPWNVVVSRIRRRSPGIFESTSSMSFFIISVSHQLLAEKKSTKRLVMTKKSKNNKQNYLVSLWNRSDSCKKRFLRRHRLHITKNKIVEHF